GLCLPAPPNLVADGPRRPPPFRRPLGANFIAHVDAYLAGDVLRVALRASLGLDLRDDEDVLSVRTDDLDAAVLPPVHTELGAGGNRLPADIAVLLAVVVARIAPAAAVVEPSLRASRLLCERLG